MKKVVFLFFLGFLCVQGIGAQTTGDEQGAQIQKVKVFPNPATNVVNVLGLLNTAKARISISDLHGNIFLEHYWEIRNHAVNIPISDLNPGIYMIGIQSKEQTVRTKFYKQ